MRIKKTIFYGFITLAGLLSCIKEDVTNIGSHINIKPEYAIPIGSPSVYFSDFLNSINPLISADTSQISDTTDIFQYDDRYYKKPEELYYSLTEEFSLSSFQENLEHITSLMFRTNVINFIPAQVLAQTYFLDKNYAIIDSLYKQGAIVLESAETDNDGNVTAPYVLMEYDSYFTKDEIQNLEGVNYIEIKTWLNIEKSETIISKFYSDQDLWIQLGAKIKLDVYLDEF